MIIPQTKSKELYIKMAEDILKLETRIARASWSVTSSRDVTKTYNSMSLEGLASYAPGFDWKRYFFAAGLSKASKVIVSQNTAIRSIAQIFGETTLETLKIWQIFRTVDGAAPYLSERFVSAHWSFNYRELTGVQKRKPLWKYGVHFVENLLGEALGRKYVATYFSSESKKVVLSIVDDLLTAMASRIEALDWMSRVTKDKALEKLSKFIVKIGYPEKWQDYSGLKVKADDLFGNAQRSIAFGWSWQLSRLDQPIDPTEWDMTPQTVNAYYSLTRNEIVFPAAILQPPFFNPEADMAVNYGAIGGIIGHEITHAFDDQGRYYDGEGKLEDWWKAEDFERFSTETKKYVRQYDHFEALPGIYVQGSLTLGENIADLCGNLLALDAYRLYLARQKQRPVMLLDGFTEDQRILAAFAQLWCRKYRDDELKKRIVTDPHSPAVFRVIGPVRNIDAWYKAFDVKPGDKYYLAPEDRVHIW